MATPRNPLLDFGIVIIAAGILLPLVSATVLLLDFLGFFYPYLIIFYEWQWLHIYVLCVCFGLGVGIGRKSSFGWTASAGSFIGGFPGAVMFQTFIWPTGWGVLFTLGMGGLCALGGLAGQHSARPKAQQFNVPVRERRCSACGIRVGASATRCWSCRAALPRT